MNGMILFLVLLFGGIAIWAGYKLMSDDRKSEPVPRPRAFKPAQASADPWGAGRMRRRERDSLRPGERLLI